MFLRRIVIENYRNYLHTEIELTEGLNVIVGPNNSGKSNLLNVINFLSSNSLKEKKFSVDDINKNDLFSNYAKYLTEPPQIKITYDIEHIMNYSKEDSAFTRLQNFIIYDDGKLESIDENCERINASIELKYEFDIQYISDYCKTMEGITSYKDFIKALKNFENRYQWVFYDVTSGTKQERKIVNDIFEIEFIEATRMIDGLTTNSRKFVTQKCDELSIPMAEIKNEMTNTLQVRFKPVTDQINTDISKDQDGIGITNGRNRFVSSFEYTGALSDCFKYELEDETFSYNLPLDNNGLGYNNLIYMRNLKEYRQILYSVRYKFPYFFIDEYQDTVKLQNEFLLLLGESSTVTIGVIGDAAQAIYGFAGAEYQDFYNFTLSSKQFNTYVIEDNRRSNQNIIYLLNYCRKDDYALKQQKCAKNTMDTNKVHFVLCNNRDTDLLKILPPDTMVLCRRWTDAFSFIRDLSLEQRNAVQSIHKYETYSAGRNVVDDFEKEQWVWISQISYIVNIEKALNSRNFAKICQECSKIFDLSKLINSSTEQVAQLKALKSFTNKMRTLPSLQNYKKMIEYINQSAIESGLTINNLFEIIDDASESYNANLHPYINILQYGTLKKMVDEIFVKNGRYVTVHKTKGKEYDNVLTSLETSYRDNSSKLMNVMINPHIFVDLNDANQSELGEYVRIMYVALSRAKNNLYIHVKSDQQQFIKVEKALAAYSKSIGLGELFYEVIDLNT